MDFKKIEKHYQKASYHKQHPELTLHEWQYALRKKYAEKSVFGLEKMDGHPIYADYVVKNPEKKSNYKVSIRDNMNSMNYCSCFDFKTNNLGTCKHIEYVLHKIRSNKKLSGKLSDKFIPEYTSLYIDYGDNREIKLRIGSKNREAFLELKSEYFNDDNTLSMANYPDFYKIYNEANKIDSDFRCYPDVISKIVEYKDKGQRKKIVDNNYPATNGAFDQLINASLFPYQKEGVQFAAKAGRSLLADDMGLGKTIQAIATVELLNKELGIEKVLIVCPTSLKYQWKTEIQKFTDAKITVIEGLPHKRGPQYTDDSLFCIVSYHTATNDIETLEKLKPDMVILDEAQRIKNFNTKISRTIKRIPSDYAMVLTGTPLENKLEELYSIVQFIDPFILGPYHEFMARHQVKDDAGKVIGYKDLNHIGEKLSGLMIRRTKKQVLKQLPERMDKTLFVPMSPVQMDWHEEYKSIVSKIVQKWRRMGFLSEKDRNKLMINLNLMRMVCDSTYLVDQETRHDTKVDELISIVDEVVSNEESKLVIFTQWKRMARLIIAELEKKGIHYEYLNGDVPSAKREQLFYNFNKNPEVKVFLSTDAGGVGLNLQAASYLVNVDIPWNPAVLEQRIARIHRLGQKSKVNIINMVSTGTIEHRMLDVISFKSSLAEGILDAGEDAIFLEESKFKKFMSSMDDMLATDKEEEQKPVVEPVEEDVRQPEKEQEKERQLELFDDEKTEPEADKAFEEEPVAQVPEEENILAQGLKFLGKLSETLSDTESTRKLVASVTEKDKKTGKTYLKVPVEDEKMIENAVTLIGKVLQGLK